MCRETTEKIAANKQEQIPLLARTWCAAYDAIPKCNVPFTNLRISFCIASAFFLMTVRLVTKKILLTVFQFPDVPETEGAAASIPCIVHSSMLVPPLALCFMTHSYSPSQHISKAPQWWQNFVDALLQFCTGYMVYDGIFILLLKMDIPNGVYIPALDMDDLLFLSHHFLTSFYMSSTRIYKAGHMSAMMCMLCGEISNPFQNTYLFSKKAMLINMHDNMELHLFLENSFSAVYLLFRTVIGPLFFAHITYDLLFTKQAKENLPFALRSIFVSMIWAVVFGSVGWIIFTYENLVRNFNLSGEGQEL